MKSMQLAFGIRAWHAWAPELPVHPAFAGFAQKFPAGTDFGSEKPDVGFVEPMLRRRLSPIGRSGLSALHQLQANPVNESESWPVVFASRHGDLARTVEMLTAIGQSQPLSPTAFGLTVHNAIVGLAAILKQNKAPAIALAGGIDTFWHGLVDAVVRSRIESRPYWYVYADMPRPEIYNAYIDHPETPIAFAMLLDATSPAATHITLTTQDSGDQSSNTDKNYGDHGLAPLAFWLSLVKQSASQENIEAMFNGETQCWTWCVNALASSSPVDDRAAC